MRLRAATALCAIALLAASCSSNKNDSESAASTTASTVTATTSTTSAPKHLDAGALVDAFRAKGLPVAEVKVFTAADDPNQQLGRPGGYTSKASWHDSRLEKYDEFDVSGGGSVEVFDNAADAQTRYDYTDSLTRGNAMLNEYHWIVGTAFVRVSKAFTPDQAEVYHAAATDALS